MAWHDLDLQSQGSPSCHLMQTGCVEPSANCAIEIHAGSSVDCCLTWSPEMNGMSAQVESIMHVLNCWLIFSCPSDGQFEFAQAPHAGCHL